MSPSSGDREEFILNLFHEDLHTVLLTGECQYVSSFRMSSGPNNLESALPKALTERCRKLQKVHIDWFSVALSSKFPIVFAERARNLCSLRLHIDSASPGKRFARNIAKLKTSLTDLQLLPSGTVCMMDIHSRQFLKVVFGLDGTHTSDSDSSLEHLDISGVELSNDAAQVLGKWLQARTNLRTLGINANDTDVAGVLAIGISCQQVRVDPLPHTLHKFTPTL